MLSRVSDAIVSFTTTLKLDLVTCFPGEEVDSEKVSTLPNVLYLVNRKARTSSCWFPPGLLPPPLPLLARLTG